MLGKQVGYDSVSQIIVGTGLMIGNWIWLSRVSRAWLDFEHDQAESIYRAKKILKP